MPSPGALQIAATIFWAGWVAFFAALLAGRRRRWFRYVPPIVVPLTLGLLIIVGRWPNAQVFFNWLLTPERSFGLAALGLTLAIAYYRTWTRPWIGLPLLILFACGYGLAARDEHFFRIISRPDNVAITLLIFSTLFFLWVALRRMAINDRRAERGQPPAEGSGEDKVLSWPDLFLAELLLMVVATAGLIVWAILIRAPLEAPADPNTAPNPAKAPWYFLGLQELLVYFDPWFAGALLPLLILFGLCALPYVDRNPAGNGYYTFRERPVAIGLFLGGFILIGLVPILVGTFLRGPNWTAFGPLEPWDPAAGPSPASVNLSDLFWTGLSGREPPGGGSVASAYAVLLRELPGIVLLAAYFGALPIVLRKTLLRRIGNRIGGLRYAIMILPLLCLSLVPLKMMLRWLFNVKYILAIGEWSFNI